MTGPPARTPIRKPSDTRARTPADLIRESQDARMRAERDRIEAGKIKPAKPSHADHEAGFHSSARG